MQRNQRIILYFLVLIAGGSWIELSTRSAGQVKHTTTSAPQTGFSSPDFALTAISGEMYKLSDYKGRPILINLWATWCPPCRAEMTVIEKMYQEYKGQGFIVLAVNMTYQDDPSKVATFSQKNGLSFPILLDETGGIASLYQLRSLPTSYFIDRGGIIRDIVIGGPMSEALLRISIEQIIQ